MAGRNFYAILGVPTRAEFEEIKHAYRRLVLALHPDSGDYPDSEHFREVQEAYQTLRDPALRRAYDMGIAGARVTAAAEPLRAHQPFAIFNDFLTLRPSIDELFDQIRQNFFGYRNKSGGPFHRMNAEVILDGEEARFGCRLPLTLPVYGVCPQCNGTGDWWGLCHRCEGQGIVAKSRNLTIDLPPGTRDGDHYEIDLSEGGIGNISLDLRVVVE